MAASFQSNALAASAATADGRVRLAQRDGAGARDAFEAAVRQWSEIGAPYETALARMGLAEALKAEGQQDRASLELRAALATFERIRATHPARPPAPPATEETPPCDASVFRCEGDTWLIVFGGQSARLRDSKGLRYLARLIAEPAREVSALELVALESGGRQSANDRVDLAVEGDAGPLLDARAKEAYRRRLAEIDEDLAEARAADDARRAAQAGSERDFLRRELARAVGLGGRERRAGSASERTRSAVTRALRQALSRIREQHVPLAEHLDRTIRTGAYCVYEPDPRLPLAWTI